MLWSQAFVGSPPFASLGWASASLSILRGYREPRPLAEDSRGRPMTDGEWQICQLCWSQEAEDRPSIDVIRLALESDAKSPPPTASEAEDANEPMETSHDSGKD
jgi:hypothetical protein